MATTSDPNGRTVWVSEDDKIVRYETYLFDGEGSLNAAPIMLMAINAAQREFPAQLLEVHVIVRPAEVQRA